MGLAISFVLMTGVFIILVALEHRSARRADAVLTIVNQQIAASADRVNARYREKFGRDPTEALPLSIGQIPTKPQK